MGPWIGGSAKSVALVVLGAATADGSLKGALKVSRRFRVIELPLFLLYVP